MKQIILAACMVLLMAVPSLAFELGEWQFHNRVKLMKIFSDTDRFEMRGEHNIVIRKKGSPFFLSNNYQRDFEFSGERPTDNPKGPGDQWQNRTTVGVDINSWSAMIVDRHEYSYKVHGQDDIIYRAGFEFKF